MDQSDPGNGEIWGGHLCHLRLSLAQEVAISMQTPFNQASSCQVQTLVSVYSKEGMSIWCLSRTSLSLLFSCQGERNSNKHSVKWLKGLFALGPSFRSHDFPSPWWGYKSPIHREKTNNVNKWTVKLPNTTLLRWVIRMKLPTGCVWISFSGALSFDLIGTWLCA